MMELNEFECVLAELLLTSVLNKTGKPTYKELAEQLSNRLGKPVDPHFDLSTPLANVSQACFDMGLPLLSAFVVYSGATNRKKASKGFYLFARGLRPEYHGMTEEETWEKELCRINECQEWYKLADYLGLEIGGDRPGLYPDDLMADAKTYKEGAAIRVVVNAYERSTQARRDCLAAHGYAYRCAVCGFNFAERYGDAFKGLIHVHHLIPVSELPEGYRINPKEDMIPICPNCHMAIHAKTGGVYTVEELRAFWEKNNQGSGH